MAMTRTAGHLVRVALASGMVALAAAAPAQALTAQECSAKYQAAKTAGTLGGQSWLDFRKAQCGADAAAAPAATAPATAVAPKAETKAGERKQAAAPATPANPAIFPSAVDPKYAKETAAKARIKTCADQWQANKATNATGGLRWIQKGGGYWSECNKKLKGA